MISLLPAHCRRAGILLSRQLQALDALCSFLASETLCAAEIEERRLPPPRDSALAHAAYSLLCAARSADIKKRAI